MRKRIISLGVMALLFAACSVNEMYIATPTDKDAEEFFATIEDASTRVFVDDDLMVLWHADDRVSIFNKYTYNQQYRFTGNTGANSGSFTKVPNDDFVTGNALNSVYAIYPYKESTEISNQGVLTIDLPATQSYADNSFGVGANTMVSCSEGNELLFKNLCGYIMLKLYGDNVTVKSISIKGNNDEPLAGKATVNASLESVPTMSFDASATKEITLTFDTPVTLGTTFETATSFWLVVPPTTFSKGITLTVKDNKNGEFKKATTASLQVSRNTLKRMSALEAIPEPSDDAIVFADDNLKERLVAKFDTNGDGELSYKEAAAVTSFEGAITIATISSFNEFQFFTGLTSIPKECFKNWAKLESIILPNTITSIGDSAFYGCSALHGITIPNSVKSIGNNVFNGCSSIISIELPNSITRIEQRTFYNCISLKAISIPKSLNYIGKEAFAKCYEMTKIYVESLTSWLNIQCTEYGSHPFFNDEVEGELYIAGNELTDVTIPKEITTIRTNAFKNCTHISKVTIHSNVSSIGEYAFYRTNTSNIVIPESVRTIGSHAFAICTKLSSISLPESVTELGDDAFFKCESLVSIIIPESITKINDGVFFHCTGLTSVILPNSITSIGDMSFSGCTALTSIELPESLVELVRMSFYECTGLASITIPKNVTKISDSFSNCTGLNSIIMYPVTPPTGRAGMLYLTNDCPIYVPAESVDAYKTADYWSSYANRIQAIGTPQAVDLGLPSGVKWASFNLGASKPEEYGDYYAWGEIEPKQDSSWETYKWCMGSFYTLTKYCSISSWGYNGFTDTKTVLDPEDDAANVNLGGTWRMPTKTDFEELCNNCTWEWIAMNGSNGRKVTGPNGNSIFLPAAGYRDGTRLCDVDSAGRYWSSSLDVTPYYAWYMDFFSSDVFRGASARFGSRSIRPVCD